MAVGELAVELPRCEMPGHDGRTVVRDGFKGKAPARRQRYRCVNPDDRSDWHRFTLRVPRAVTTSHRCEGCSQVVPTHAGPPVAAGYHYLAGIIASTLAGVARGDTYADASVSARMSLARAARAGGLSSGGVSRNGQLAADWVEVFTDVVLPPRPVQWPGVVLLDSTRFWRRFDHTKVLAFNVLFAYGYDLTHGPSQSNAWPEQQLPQAVNGRLLAAQLSRGTKAAQWKTFLTSRPGRPVVVVSDGDPAIIKAINSTWKSGTGAATTTVRCVWHAEQNLRKAVISDMRRVRTHDRSTSDAEPEDDPLLKTLRPALMDPFGMNVLTAELTTRFGDHGAFATGRKPASLRWLAATGPSMHNQAVQAAAHGAPMSVGPLEASITNFRQLLARRVQSLRNADRTDKLLRLLVAGVCNEAVADHWSALIYEQLAANDGRASTRQREIAGQFFW